MFTKSHKFAVLNPKLTMVKMKIGHQSPLNGVEHLTSIIQQDGRTVFSYSSAFFIIILLSAEDACLIT